MFRLTLERKASERQGSELDYRYHFHLQKVIMVGPHPRLSGLLWSAERKITLEGKGFQLSFAGWGVWMSAGPWGPGVFLKSVPWWDCLRGLRAGLDLLVCRETWAGSLIVDTVMNLLLSWALKAPDILITYVIPANNNSVTISNYLSFCPELLTGCKGWELQSVLLRQPGPVLRLPLTSCLGMQSWLLHKMWLTLFLSRTHTHTLTGLFLWQNFTFSMIYS